MKTPNEIINSIMMNVMQIAVKAQETHNFDKDEKFIPCRILNRAILDITDQIDREERDQEQKRRDDERWAKKNQPIKKFLFIEEGSVEDRNLIDEFNERNPEIKIIFYKKGGQRPEILDMEEKQ